MEDLIKTNRPPEKFPVSAEKIVQFIYGCSPTSIDKNVLLVVNQKLMKLLIDDLDRIEIDAGRWGRVVTGVINGKRVTLIQGVGTCGDETYFLKYTPCQRALFCGGIGYLGDKAEIGDVLIPTKCIVGEGFSQYVSSDAEQSSDTELTEALYHYLKPRVNKKIVSCKTFTTGALASETRKFLEGLKSRDLLGIELQLSAVFAGANAADIPIASACYITDLTLEKNTIFEDNREVRPVWTDTRCKLGGLMVDFLTS